jgi:hypothetical protein
VRVSARVEFSASGAAARRLCLLLALACAAVLASAGVASAAQFSGTITDHWSGAPLGGVQLIVDRIGAGEGEAAGLEVGTPVANTETDSAGHWEVQVQPGEYWVLAEAPGYDHVDLGAPIGNGGAEHFDVGEAGLNVATQMVPDDTAFMTLYPTVMRWTNVPKEGFRSMALALEYESFALVPSSWPESSIVTEIVDAQGHPVWPKELTKEGLIRPGESMGVGAGSQEYGSAEGCQFFSSIPLKQRPAVEGLKVVSYLKSDPAVRAEEVIKPDFSECEKTELEIANPQVFEHRKVLVYLSATIVDRLPLEQKVPGVMYYVVNGHRPIAVHVKNATEPASTAKASRFIRPGRNKVAVSFTPSVDSVTAPAPQELSFYVSKSYFRHPH